MAEIIYRGIVCYEKPSGRLRSTLGVTQDENLSQFDTDEFGFVIPSQAVYDLVLHDINGHYYDGLGIAKRHKMPVTQDGNTLTVPPNTKFEVYGPAELTGIADDGVLEFEFSEPGTYTITLTNFPYLDAEVTLEG